MADYMRQQIIDTIVTDLEGITIANGYKTNAGKNVERKLTALSLVEKFPYLSVCDGREELRDETNRDVVCNLTVMIYGYVEDKTDPHSVLNKVVGDIKRALWSDPEREDLAYSTTVTSISTDEGLLSMEDKSMFALECNVEYSHPRTEP